MLNHLSKCSARSSSTVEGFLVTRQRDKVILQFNRPEKLNAQTIEIQACLAENLDCFENDPTVSAVIIKGNKASFSAGGDVVQFRKMLETDESRNYFYDKGAIFYRGLLRLTEYKKPVIALGDGICMGGGAAVTFLSSHPVTTERTIFAMPEIFIGFYPNVGANHFLQLPQNIGMWLAMTGKRLIGSEILKVGLSKNYVRSDDINKLEEALISLEGADHDSVSKTIGKFQSKPDFSNCNCDFNQVESLFAGSSVEEIVENLRKYNSEFSIKILNLFSTLSPTALKVTFNLLQQSRLRQYNTNDAFSADFSLFQNFYGKSDGANDFSEGIRSVLIDKNHKPNWIPKSLSEVDDEKLISYFTNNIFDVRLGAPRLYARL